MQINQLITFLEVVKTGHFREAARRLNLTQPAVSAQIRSLEESLGSALFHRQPVSLTAAGKAFLPHARQMIALAETGRRAVQDSQTTQRGSITVGASSGAALAVLPRMLRYFHGNQPDVRVSVHTLPASTIINGLHEGRLDAGILYGSLEDTELVRQVLLYDRFVLITPYDHTLAIHSYLSMDELKTTPLISLTPETPERQLLNRLFSVKGIQPETAIELSSVEEVKRSVRLKLGIAIVPRLSLDDELDRDLRWIYLTGSDEQFPVVLLRPRDQHLSPTLHHFLEDIRGIYPSPWND
ncbi:LysR family transcriptional regulator [Desmospora activa]|uniref:LysR family cyn operon transcriptional activator n=1 Tax=Desmospora activa DSM 45169 TaxID=1121389 RepID=A0A2T4ZDE2_9BACL|nr:LysR family transcriptional regulator [Desmospora activa]PTM59911.1 LysR family cyn operon transcriptional activator [Desmospora activa DSM 45169]